MSLEQQIEKLNAGLNELVAILTAEAKRRIPTEGSFRVVSGQAAASVGKLADQPKTATSKKAASAAETEEVEAIADEVVSKLTRDLLQKRGREKAIELLASFGAKKATDLAATDRPKFVADAKTLLA